MTDEEFFNKLIEDYSLSIGELKRIESIWDELHEVTRLMYKAFYKNKEYSPSHDLKRMDEAFRNYFFNKKIQEIIND